MRNFLLLFSLLSIGFCANAQELNSTVTIDAEQTGQPNLQLFRTLEQQLLEFINNTTWTDKTYKNQERIDCNFTLVINQYEGDSFSGTLQIQSSRPIFESIYDSPVYNYNDRQISFSYKEFEPLNFNINSFTSNLVSVIAYHVYTIIGLDAGTYTLNGGQEYFEIGKQIVNTAASSNFAGWKATDGNQSRYRYNDAVLSNVYKEFHETMYVYHRQGLDAMAADQKKAKQAIIGSINTLKSINDRRPNSFLVRTFFDAKADELQAIYSGGPSVEISGLVENLNSMAPTNRSNWSEIKF